MKRLLAVLVMALLVLTAAPAAAAQPVEARELPYQCRPDGTTVTPVRLINRTDMPQRFEVFDYIVKRNENHSRTRWVTVLGTSSKTIRFRSSRDHYRAWVIHSSEGDLLTAKIFTSFC